MLLFLGNNIVTMSGHHREGRLPSLGMPRTRALVMTASNPPPLQQALFEGTWMDFISSSGFKVSSLTRVGNMNLTLDVTVVKRPYGLLQRNNGPAIWFSMAPRGATLGSRIPTQDIQPCLFGQKVTCSPVKLPGLRWVIGHLCCWWRRKVIKHTGSGPSCFGGGRVFMNLWPPGVR